MDSQEEKNSNIIVRFTFLVLHHRTMFFNSCHSISRMVHGIMLTLHNVGDHSNYGLVIEYLPGNAPILTSLELGSLVGASLFPSVERLLTFLSLSSSQPVAE
jgi:hypothetical protein